MKTKLLLQNRGVLSAYEHYSFDLDAYYWQYEARQYNVLYWTFYSEWR